MTAESSSLFARVPLVFLQAGYSKQIIAIYAALASFQGKDQSCFPSLVQVSKRAGICYGAASRSISLLQSEGWIHIQRRGRFSNIYTVHAKQGLWAMLPLSLLQSKLRRSDILIYAALAIYQGGKENCYPSRKELTERAKVHASTVSKSISRLKKSGFLQSIQRGRSANLYACAGVSASQWPELQNKTGSQWPELQDKNVSQWPFGQTHSDQNCKSSIKRSHKRSSSSVSVPIYRTLDVHSGQNHKTELVHSSQNYKISQAHSGQNHKSKTNQCLHLQHKQHKTVPEIMGQASTIRRINMNNQKNSKPLTNTCAHSTSSVGNRPLHTAQVRQTNTIKKTITLQTVLQTLYSEIYNKIKDAFIYEQDGVIYLDSRLDTFIKQKIKYLLGIRVVFQDKLSKNTDPLEKLDKTIRPFLTQTSRQKIKGAIIKVEQGRIFINKSDLLPHIVTLLKKVLGSSIVFEARAVSARAACAVSVSARAACAVSVSARAVREKQSNHSKAASG